MRLRRQNGPADMHDTIAAMIGQVERRTDLRAGSRRSEISREHMRIAFGPHHNGAAFAQVGNIDPGRMIRHAVDQHARLRALARIVCDIAAVPHRADDVVRPLAGRFREALRDRFRKTIARKEGGAIAMIVAGQHQIVRAKRGDKPRNASSTIRLIARNG